MKKSIRRMAILLICILVLPQTVFGAELLIPGGQVVGLELTGDHVTVAAFDETLGKAARTAGVEVGDRIVSIDGRTISSAEDVRQALARSGGTVSVAVVRDGKKLTFTLQPEITQEGPKLGIYLRQGVTGIGTITWYDPQTGSFGTLGHGVHDGKGSLVTMTGGRAYRARVMSVKKGRVGQPGQLMGMLQGETPIGALAKNSPCGVFGSLDDQQIGEPVPVAAADQVRTGPATIRSTVEGDQVQEYSVEILKIYSKNKDNNRNMLLRITDPALLAATGGIVQGMSGSPILQNGRIVGAVTHVLVNDPTTGYGIFIENMLDAAA